MAQTEQAEGVRSDEDFAARVGRWIRLIQRFLFRRLPAEEARDVRQHVDEEADLTERYVLMTALSAGIATLGLLQSSTAVVIGAMLISPLMAPIAKLGFAFASLDGRRAQDAARVLAIGAAVGVFLGMALTWLSPIRNATPEIIGRTAPTLLDLAVAVLSGLAGGYATVHRRGETAIGVAIATALMPPLATLGYSLAVGRFDFAFGALLLFLTNLAAIAFSFALVARIRGVARPIAKVEFRWRFVIMGLAAFFVLATPLALTLLRVSHEARASILAREEICKTLKIDPSQVAQLTVSWANLSTPQITATAITPNFDDNAQNRVSERLTDRLGAPVELRLQQIVAADPRAQTEALIQAAIANDGAAKTASQPAAPIDQVRKAARAPIGQAWADSAGHAVILLAAPSDSWDLAAYRAEETRLSAMKFGWTVQIIPPYRDRLPVIFEDDSAAVGAAQKTRIETVIWALKRWGVSKVSIEGFAGPNPNANRTTRLLAETRAAGVGAMMEARQIATTVRLGTRETGATLTGQGEGRLRSADVVVFGTSATAP